MYALVILYQLLQDNPALMTFNTQPLSISLQKKTGKAMFCAH